VSYRTAPVRAIERQGQSTDRELSPDRLGQSRDGTRSVGGFQQNKGPCSHGSPCVGHLARCREPEMRNLLRAARPDGLSNGLMLDSGSSPYVVFERRQRLHDALIRSPGWPSCCSRSKPNRCSPFCSGTSPTRVPPRRTGSDIMPRNPTRRRSDGSVGSYTPSASAMSTWNIAHHFSNWSQSRHEWDSRLTWRPKMGPTCPSDTSASSRWKPGRFSTAAPLMSCRRFGLSEADQVSRNNGLDRVRGWSAISAAAGNRSFFASPHTAFAGQPPAVQ
jgi:hypothetical protein